MKVSQFVYYYFCFSDQTQNTENFTNSGTFIMCTLNKCLLFPICIFILVSSLILSSDALDTINVTQTITDGDTIVSSAGRFELGFFSPGKSKNRYVGIWYKTIDVTTPVWVANRETPLTDSLGTLKILKSGKLVILNGTNQVIWYSSNVSSFVQNPVVQLLDSGNLVIKNEGEENPGNFIWKSFDYPGNTIIAGMKMGKNFETGHEWKLTSWKSEHDPSPGDYTYRIDTHGFPQLIMWKGVNESFRVGPWIGDQFSGQPELKENIVFQYKFMFSKEEVNFSVGVLSSSLPRTVLNPDGVMKWWTWPDRRTGWVTYSSGPPSDSCDNYATCGPYGRCNVDINPFCVCLDKFVTKYPRNYDAGDWSSGCIRRTPLDCEKGDTFLKYSGMKLPDTRMARFNTSMSLEECRVMCLGDCSCMAYSNMNFTEGGSGCFLWFSELMDLRSLVDGQDVYIRMASSEAEAMAKIQNENNREKIILSLTLTIGVLLLFLGLISYLRKMKCRLKVKNEISETRIHCPVESQGEDLSLSLFDLATILKACNNFSVCNKLGEGGYGPVYMGVLDGGREIAVKSLSKKSSQGLNEFKNEVVFIAKLQHRNLVKLLGCCIEGEEKMLIYEYMPNKSLDSFIFDKTKCTLLDWPKRFNIINGISRGLLYLHQDSRFSIIHRDLKTENILLDTDMNPKISDFGMARSFQGDESEAKTRRLAGTYGYMSPEYAIHGIFSVKSDVFSFGVMVLEIISGKRNRGFSHPDHHLNLLGHAWILHMEGKSLELVDASMINACHSSEILRSIHVALLCVQHYRSDRPTMASVVVMLTSDIALAQPKRPGFFTEDDCLEAECVTSEKRPSSLNEISFTELNAR